jgi:hypothetical protein
LTNKLEQIGECCVILKFDYTRISHVLVFALSVFILYEHKLKMYFYARNLVPMGTNNCQSSIENLGLLKSRFHRKGKQRLRRYDCYSDENKNDWSNDLKCIQFQ